MLERMCLFVCAHPHAHPHPCLLDRLKEFCNPACTCYRHIFACARLYVLVCARVTTFLQQCCVQLVGKRSFSHLIKLVFNALQCDHPPDIDISNRKGKTIRHLVQAALPG